jgi:hypothetical protein
MISASVAPLGRPINSRIFPPFLSARGAISAFAAFFAGFFVAGFAALAPFLALGGSFFELAPFFEAALVGATGAPCAATAAAVSMAVASAFVMALILSAVDPRTSIHHSGAAKRQGICAGVVGGWPWLRIPRVSQFPPPSICSCRSGMPS